MLEDQSSGSVSEWGGDGLGQRPVTALGRGIDGEISLPIGDPKRREAEVAGGWSWVRQVWGRPRVVDGTRQDQRCRLGPGRSGYWDVTKSTPFLLGEVEQSREYLGDGTDLMS